MKQQTIFIKGMVCNRCLMTIEAELKGMGNQTINVSLGEVSFVPGEQHDNDRLKHRLANLGFGLLENKKTKLADSVKGLVAELYSGDFDFPSRFRFSDLVKERFETEYENVRDAFIAREKKTIEQYIIEFRINKVKEFLVYSNDTLTDIAFKLNFSSVAHLSAHFKSQTGLTTTFFRNVKSGKTKHEFQEKLKNINNCA